MSTKLHAVLPDGGPGSDEAFRARNPNRLGVDATYRTDTDRAERQRVGQEVA